MDEDQGTPTEEEAPTEEAEKQREGPISLHPLNFEDAVDALLRVKPEPAPTRPRKPKA